VHIHLDVVGGLAGDMFVAALLSARPELTKGTVAAMRSVGLPRRCRPVVMEHRQHGLVGTRFLLEIPANRKPSPRTYADFRGMVEDAPLNESVGARAVDILRLLAEAESRVHGKPVDEVVFHEIGDWDTLADAVGAAFLIEALPGAEWSVSPLPLGAGRVKTAHGSLPVPAPATAELLAGFELFDDGVPGERITPTGAAILKHLGPRQGGPRQPSSLITTGHGFGSRDLQGVPNVLRVLVFGDAASGRRETPEEVAVLAFEIDDQTAEDLAVGLDKLRARDDVLDVLQSAAFGKKGRLVAAVQLLCRPEDVEAVAAACFAETTTIGLRWHRVRRAVLDRQAAEIDGVRVKVIDRPGRRTAKAEMDDLAAGAGGHAGRDAARQTTETKALSRSKKRNKIEGA
jgi:uncharacterized protein (TIGR00299 family) protein